MKRLALVVVLLASGGWSWDVLRAPDPDVEKGNGAFAEGKYSEALGHYDAAEKRGADPRIQFDRGAALYKLGEQATDPAEKAKLMEQAEQAFERAADTEDARVKSDAYQALGNTLYQRERYEEAVDKYRRALRADPQNDAARYNLEMALRQRQKNPQQQPQQGQQGQQGQQQGQQGQQPDQQQGQQGQQQGQQGQQPDQQQGQQQGQGQQQQQDPQQQGQGQQQQDPQQGQGQGQQQQKDPSQGDPNAPKQDPGQGQQGQPDQQGQEPKSDPRKGQRPEPGGGDDESETPSDEDQKLDALEKRSRDLRKRLLRKGSRTRDPLRLPSRKDW